MTSQASGYVTFEKYSYRFFNVPSEYVIMVTLRTNVVLFMGHLFYRPQEAEVGKYLPKKVHTPYILHGPGYLRFEVLGFNCPPSNCSRLLLFSYLPVQHEPHKLANALFNCSVEYYVSFKMHLQCDWKYDCEDGRDEREQCPSRGPDCQGRLQSCTECYSAHSGDVLEAFNSSRRHFPDKTDIAICSLPDDHDKQNIRKTPHANLALFPSFLCAEYSLSFSQVCDFRYDCPDGGDESFCQYSLCVGSFQCLNGQCISYDKWCDPMTHCLDDSDLRGCNERIKDRKSNRYFRRSPVLISFDGTGLFQSTVMAVNESCPESHYRCPGELNDCLPVYTRCNELHDCAGYEDEKECETMICPGFFRCRKSSICVHDDHLCDGWPHCPLHDDEMVCESSCPIHCLCLGHSFLCPSEILPDNFDRSSCHAPGVGFSSCKDLLKSVAYRSFLWLVCSLSLIGNAFCFVTRMWTTKSGAASGFSVFVLNLTVADFLMGNYIAVIGTADHLYRGQYLLHDDTWRRSSACKAAGCLSVLSSEVSALTVWLITLDRFIVLRFPFTTLRFRGTSASIASLLTWIIGLCLAMIPLLPANSQWEFYSQSSICIPLSVTDEKFKGRMYSLSVFIIFNFGLFLLISCGQAFIYWSVQRNALASTSTRRSHDVTIARRLITVAVTDFMCWFPIGLCGLLALNRVPVPEEMNIALIVFILPLNSALNPFLYTFNSLADKARKANEVRMLQWLEVNTG
ncbi:hypothetical protein ACOMHN_050330 [Nucella lapillus]